MHDVKDVTRRLALLSASLIAVSCGGHGTGGDAATDTSVDDAAVEEDDADDADQADAAEDGVEDDTEGDAADVGDEEWTAPPLAWEPCPLHEDGSDWIAECATMDVPLRWGDWDGRTFTIAVKRLPRIVPTLSGQMWFLEGGPGGAGSYGYPDYMFWIRDNYQAWESYTIDARGTGRSQFLPCPSGPSLEEVDFTSTLDEVQYCIDSLEATHGSDLDAYGATQCANDLNALVQATRAPGSRVIVWGNSAGTFWAHRFLALFPDSVDGVVVEALLPPDFFGGFQDEGLEQVVRSILAMCASDAFCSSRLPDPLGALSSLVAAMEAGHCADRGWTVARMRSLIGFLVYYRPYNQAIPGLIHRLARCDAADAAALDTLEAENFLPGAPSGFSIAVFFNEYLSEMWDHPLYAGTDAYIEYLDAVYADALVLEGGGYAMHEIWSMWPRYEDPLDDDWAVTDTPMLMLQGQLDPATIYDMAVSMRDHFTGPHQVFVDFPTGAHGAIFNTPTGGASDCGVDLLRQFMADPLATIDTSCRDEVLPLDFEGAYDAPRIMGAPDFWEN